jgi:branched-chain amino acid transport system substrate-binding protein
MKKNFLILFAIYSLSHLSFSHAESPKKLRIGAMAELTGPGALNGEACLLGYKITEDLFQKKSPTISSNVEVIIGDHRREQREAINEFQRFSELSALAVVANHGIIGVAINPISKRKKIPLFGVMGHESFISDNPYAYRIIATPQQEGGGLAEQAYKDGARKVAILILEDDYILAIAKNFEGRFKELGGQVVYKDFFEEKFSDFGTIATKIRNSKADVIAMTLGFQQFGPALKRLREQGAKQPVYSNYWLSYPQVIESAGIANVENSVFITERSNYPAFLESYERLAPREYFRSGVVFRCYSALASALAVLNKNPKIANREDYIRTLENLKELDLPDRHLLFKNREAQFDMELYRIKNGKPEQIKNN